MYCDYDYLVKEDESGLRYATAQTRVKRTNVTATVIDKPGGYLVDGQKLDVFQSLMAR